MEVLAHNGIARLGGMDFDQRLQNLFKAKYEEKAGCALDAESLVQTIDLVKVEEQKRSLTRRDYTRIFVAGHTVKVTRQEFEEVIHDLVAQAEVCCETVMEDAGITPGTLNGVILAGGSTRVPLVKRSVQEVFRREPIAKANVDEVIALGAAVYAGFRAGREALSPLQRVSISPMEFQEVTSKCFGTFTLSRQELEEEIELVNDVLIESGEQIPCEKTKTYSTAVDDQTVVRCRLTESGDKKREISTSWK